MRYGRADGYNFGYGSQLAYAGKMALQHLYGSGNKFETVKAHHSRFKDFAKFIKSEYKIKDARKIEIEHIYAYANKLKSDVLNQKTAVATAQNKLSSVNVVMESMKGNKQLKVSPKQFVGERTNTRSTAPMALDRDKIAIFDSKVDPIESAVMHACSEIGLRRKEATMMDYKKTLVDIKTKGFIRVTEGTKGGRNKSNSKAVARIIELKKLPVYHQQLILVTLEKNAKLQGDKRNLIEESWKKTKNQLKSDKVRDAFKSSGLKGYHDGRAAYACSRYQQITGHPAPCVNGNKVVDKMLDKKAREIIMVELGHSKERESTAYLGSSK